MHLTGDLLADQDRSDMNHLTSFSSIPDKNRESIKQSFKTTTFNENSSSFPVVTYQIVGDIKPRTKKEEKSQELQGREQIGGNN